LPMPVQPRKDMAVLVITQKLSGRILYGGGLAIGVMMLVLAATGLIEWVARAVPKSVVRGIQFGLGLQLASLALKDYVQAGGLPGYGLAAACFVLTLALLGNRKYPPALLVILLGVVYALLFNVDLGALGRGIGFTLPHISVPNTADVLTGLVALALPQLPLSLGNSILATRQITEDLFPRRAVGVRKISLTYALMNLINPFFGGVPTCHGSGGIVGHYVFGARTGGSVIIYGSLYLALGLFLSRAFGTVIQLFPLSARSRMTEGLANATAPPGWRAGSAGTEPAAQVRPEAIAVMREIGIDISGHRPKHLRDALGSDVALVIGLCQEEACPVVPGARSE